MPAARPIALDTFLLWMVALLPSTGMMLLGAGSMSPGLLAACVLILTADLVSFGRLRTDLVISSRRGRMFVGAAALLILQGLVVTVVWGQVEWVRLLGSLVSVCIVLLAAACMRYRLVRHSSAEIHRMLVWTAAMLVVLALRSLVGAPVFPPISHPRPVVVFIEPSHFALTFMPFAGYVIVQARGFWRGAIVIAALALGLALASTTLLAGLVLLLVTCLRWWQSLVLVLLCLAVGFAVGFDPSFVVNRIIYSDDTQNLSNLVLLQGWERAGLAVQATSGLGLGFQQFGVWGPSGPLQDLILTLYGDYINLFDGGSTASKLVGEFGLMGIVALLAFFVWWWRTAKSMRVALSGHRQEALGVFMDVCAIAIGVELFIRGVGYLSQSLFLFGLVFSGPPLMIRAANSVRYRVGRLSFTVRLRRELASISKTA